MESTRGRLGREASLDERHGRLADSAGVPRDLRVVVSPLQQVEVRDATGTGDGSWTVEGYAAVYEQETVLWDLPWWRVKEEIARGSFEDVVRRVDDGLELVHLNHGHDMTSAVAASNVAGIGGLELDDDFHGLRFFARVDVADPDAQRLAVKMQRGVVAQASFAFTIADEEVVYDEFDEELGRWETKFRILEVGHLYDVCACAQGAYPQTESHLRSLAAASLGRAGDPAGRRHRFDATQVAAEDGETIAPSREGRQDNSSHRRLVLAARARAARITHGGVT